MSAKTNDSNVRPKVYVVGGGFEYIRLMYNLGCDGATGLEDADVVLFTGGEDVNPKLYGEICMAKTIFNALRDQKEEAIFKAALERELPMVGICRGGQFLNVMNGGKMWQHVDGHAGRNHIARVEIPPFNGKEKHRRTVKVTSTHHQMMIPTADAIVLLTAQESRERDAPGYAQIGEHEDDPDIEAVFYDDTNCLCFQPHPEFGSAPPECVDIFEEFLDNFIYPRIPTNVPKKKKETLTVPAVKKKEK